MLRHGEGIGYTGPGSRMGPTDNFSLVTGPQKLESNSNDLGYYAGTRVYIANPRRE